MYENVLARDYFSYLCYTHKGDNRHIYNMRHIKTTIALLAALSMVGCHGRFRHPDTSACKQDVRIEPFYQDFFDEADTSVASKIERLSAKYGEYFDTYCARELRIGHVGSEEIESNMKLFLGQKENAEVIATCDSVVAQSGDKQSRRLSDALGCLAYYLPNVSLPEHYYFHVSGFNNKIFVDSAYLSVSIEHYLGSDCRYYPWLEIPMYARRSKNAENIPVDIIKALIYANKPDVSEKDDVLSAMIYQAKVMYATAACFPDVEERSIMGFTEEEWSWCKSAEKDMWGFMAEQKLLYATNPLTKNKLVNEAPFTVYFGDKSPGRAAIYCAYNIVCSYMDRHKEASIESLFDMGDAQELLIEAKYRP